MGKFMCGPFKRNIWDSSRPLSQSQPLLVFTTRSYETPGAPTCGDWCGSETTCSSGVTSSAEIFLPFFNHYTIGVGPIHPESPSLLPISICLLYILSYRTFVQLVFRWFYNLVLILMCLWDGASIEFTYSAILSEIFSVCLPYAQHDVSHLVYMHYGVEQRPCPCRALGWEWEEDSLTLCAE